MGDIGKYRQNDLPAIAVFTKLIDTNGTCAEVMWVLNLEKKQNYVEYSFHIFGFLLCRDLIKERNERPHQTTVVVRLYDKKNRCINSKLCLYGLAKSTI